MISPRTLERSPWPEQIVVPERELDSGQLRSRDVFDACRHQLVAPLTWLVSHILRKYARDADSRPGKRLANDRLDTRIDSHDEGHSIGIGQCVIAPTGKLRSSCVIDFHLIGNHERALERFHHNNIIPLDEIEIGGLWQCVVTAQDLDKVHCVAGVRHEFQQPVVMI